MSKITGLFCKATELEMLRPLVEWANKNQDPLQDVLDEQKRDLLTVCGNEWQRIAKEMPKDQPQFCADADV